MAIIFAEMIGMSKYIFQSHYLGFVKFKANIFDIGNIDFMA